MGKMLLVWLLVLLPSSAALAYDATSGCVRCHGDLAKMQDLGAEALYLDPAQVDLEVNMKGVPTCVDCHQGDPTAVTAEVAHSGMPRPLLMVNGKGLAGQAVTRQTVGLSPLEPQGEGPSALVPKMDPALAAKAGITKVSGIYWHDRDPVRFSYRPDIAKATCGKCHKVATEDFNHSSMGQLHFQRANRSFSEALPGPHNCGAWFGDNYARIAADTSVPFSEAQNASGDRNCNQCHPGCNDCHFKPFKGQGRHLFGQPEPVSCYGGQRGTICHAGPMERRRGAGFLRDEYAFPGTLYAGAHKEQGLDCLDCHSMKRHDPGFTASPQARASCRRCHAEIVDAVANSDHANVDCASCHIDEVGGYQFTFWGPGDWSGMETPYAKHAGYYGVRDFPTLIRNPEGRWLPYKPYPMAVLNQKKGLDPTGVVFREIPSRLIPAQPDVGEETAFTVSRKATQTNDALIIAGTRDELPGGKAILWIQMDKISHALGYGRDCEGCHASHAQQAISDFRYGDSRNVTAPFTGSYRIIADEKGMRFENLHTTDIKVKEGRKVEDFAPFVAFPPDAWNIQGIDFSLPFDDTRYAKSRADLEAFVQQLDALQKAAAGHEDRLKELSRVRAVSYHNLKAARDLLASTEDGHR